VLLLQPTWIGDAFLFAFETEPARIYDVQVNSALGTESWQSFSTVVGSGGTVTVSNAPATGNARFYRVQVK
jgi:hypothetical protein